jgi:hypothetical protein
MDAIYKVAGDPVASYQLYYTHSKQERNLTVYTRREKPAFLLGASSAAPEAEEADEDEF